MMVIWREPIAIYDLRQCRELITDLIRWQSVFNMIYQY